MAKAIARLVVALIGVLEASGYLPIGSGDLLAGPLDVAAGAIELAVGSMIVLAAVAKPVLRQGKRETR